MPKVLYVSHSLASFRALVESLWPSKLLATIRTGGKSMLILLVETLQDGTDNHLTVVWLCSALILRKAWSWCLGLGLGIPQAPEPTTTQAEMAAEDSPEAPRF